MASIASTDRGKSAVDDQGPSPASTRARKTSLPTVNHLPSPALTPSDPPPHIVSESELLCERAVSSPTKHVPTPDPSSESQSDGEPSHDASLANALTPVPAFVTVNVAKSRSRSNTKTSNPDGVRRLSASKMQALAAAPESLPVASLPERKQGPDNPDASLTEAICGASQAAGQRPRPFDQADTQRTARRDDGTNLRASPQGRPGVANRTVSTPPMGRRRSSGQPQQQQGSFNRRHSFQPMPRPAPLDLDSHGPHPCTSTERTGTVRSERPDMNPPSPIPPSIPLPPMSIPTLLQLELAGERPSPLYIHHSYTNDIPYESSAVKFERLKNFLLLPWFLERTMLFGALACLDAWLWTFTVLPMRFCIAASVLVRWWGYAIGHEIKSLVGFVWYGLGRMWRRARRGSSRMDESRSRSRVPGGGGPAHGRSGNPRLHENVHPHVTGSAPSRRPGTGLGGVFRHRRTKSSPSNLTSFHKADLLQGAVIVCSSIALMNLDASRMYHFIRAQSAIKLYAIYNLLEVGDRLLSALGQDVFECLFSAETLSRNSSGRSKVMLPLGMFVLALVYNILHAVILFYQVIALNVAVNSYSNALLTLLLSNQFVEIKSAVFKRFEKENTFQLACADIVERFQLWIMLLIIGMRNVVEVGGLSVPGAGSEDSGPSSFPLHTASILPASFTILPSWLWSGEVLSPFIVVIGSEMVVDWIKHAYINKFNNIKPNLYSRILDILCKDYYTNAFVTPSLTRRLGLPLLPLSCLFIRASVQIYNMFLATHLPAPLPPSTQTSLSVESASATPSSPAMRAALDRLDNIIRNALGRAVYGYPYAVTVTGTATGTGAGDDPNGTAASNSGAPPPPLPSSSLPQPWSLFGFTSDDAIAALTMVVVFLLVFLVLLVVKILLGMLLLRYARDRYARMKVKEQAVAASQHQQQQQQQEKKKQEEEGYDLRGGKRVGGYGQVEVGEDRRRWIFGDDVEGLRKVREKERRMEEKAARGEGDKDQLAGVVRYEMIAKRIW
ncbi:hypothetical protein VTK26DRAFT_6580 [Humicola hyalothermophila]